MTVLAGLSTQRGQFWAAAVLAGGATTSGSAAARFGGGLVINVGRGISDAARGASDPEAALRAAAEEWRARLAILPPDGLPPGASA